VFALLEWKGSQIYQYLLEEEFSIYYEDICITNISHDSGFIEMSTPSTPATPYSVENFVDYYWSKFSKEQVTTIWKKLGKEVAINEKVQTFKISFV
jgi:hypothetical protein